MVTFIQRILNIESLEIENNQLFSIFPSPSNQLITVKSSRDILKSMKIYDITGKLIKNIDEAFELSKTINISELQVGIYVLKINNSKSLKFFKN